MFCAKCGTKNTRTAKYCGKCGHAFSRNAERARQQGSAGRGRAPGFERERTISFDFSALNANDGAISFGEPPPRVERTSRLRESYIALLEQAVPDSPGVFTPGEDAESKAGVWADVAAPPSTPWALEGEFQTHGARQAGADFAQYGRPLSAAERPAEGRLVGWLVTFDQCEDGEDFRLRTGRMLIGADPKCDVIVSDKSVSGVHASIEYKDGRCYIKDELSRHGTFVNDTPVAEPRALESYDEIRLGKSLLRFVAVERAAKAGARRAPAAD